MIRHGETAWSLTGQHTGVTDIGLTAHGVDQSRALGPRLRGLHLAKVLVSPRLRARQTCALAGFEGASRIEPDLSEWDYGRYEGRRSDDIRTDEPGWNIWRDGCPDGESPADVSARADRFIGRMLALSGTLGRTDQETVALFSHGQFGVALAVRWIGLDLVEGQHFALHPASLSLLGVDPHHPDRRTIELWNEGLAPPSSPASDQRPMTDDSAIGQPHRQPEELP